MSFLIDSRKVKHAHDCCHADFSGNAVATSFGLRYAVARRQLDDQSLPEGDLS